MRMNRRGQVTAEMAVLFAFVIAGFVFMGFYLQRGVQGSTKANADGIGQTFSTEGSAYRSYSAADSHEENGVTKTSSCSEYQHTPGDGTALAAYNDCDRYNLVEATGIADDL